MGDRYVGQVCTVNTRTETRDIRIRTSSKEAKISAGNGTQILEFRGYSTTFRLFKRRFCLWPFAGCSVSFFFLRPVKELSHSGQDPVSTSLSLGRHRSVNTSFDVDAAAFCFGRQFESSSASRRSSRAPVLVFGAAICCCLRRSERATPAGTVPRSYDRRTQMAWRAEQCGMRRGWPPQVVCMLCCAVLRCALVCFGLLSSLSRHSS